METDMMDNGVRVKRMVLESNTGLMDAGMKEIGVMVK